MASKLNSEFNYRYQVQGDTVWEKIKTLQNFLVGRKRAAVLEEVARLKSQAKLEKLKYLKDGTGLLHEILELEAEILEAQSFTDDLANSFVLNTQEIAILEKLLQEAYEIAEPTRIQGYSDEQMFEANAANEFTMMIARELQSELLANGRPFPATLRNAMSNPTSFKMLTEAGLIPPNTVMLREDSGLVKLHFDSTEEK